MQASDSRVVTYNRPHGKCARKIDMFARQVSMVLKPNSVGEFTRTIENEIIPLLRKQKGFKDEITLIVRDGTEAVGISLWDRVADTQPRPEGSKPWITPSGS